MQTQKPWHSDIHLVHVLFWPLFLWRWGAYRVHHKFGVPLWLGAIIAWVIAAVFALGVEWMVS